MKKNNFIQSTLLLGLMSVFINCTNNEIIAPETSDTDEEVTTTTTNVDNTCLDSNYPIITELVNAGVTGGIPDNLPVATAISNSSDLQAAINTADQNGGGVIVLEPGTYPITTTIAMKNNVVLRGCSSGGVILESTIRSTSSQGKKNTIEFSNASNAGLENLTILYKVDGLEPKDRLNSGDGGWCGDCFKNNPGGVNDLYVRQIAITSTSNNCWVKNFKILKSGTDPILIAGDYNTFTNNFVDRCYNKGSNGNGYYDIRGEYNLIKNDTVKRIRHFAIQQGAKYNVVIDCYIEGDVNFHNGDAGYNLLETNTIILPTWHGWDIFGTGGASYGHQPPGPNNIMVNNTTKYKWGGPKYADPDKIYTFTGFGAPTLTNWAMPTCNTFYPVD